MVGIEADDVFIWGVKFLCHLLSPPYADFGRRHASSSLLLDSALSVQDDPRKVVVHAAILALGSSAQVEEVGQHLGHLPRVHVFGLRHGAILDREVLLQLMAVNINLERCLRVRVDLLHVDIKVVDEDLDLDIDPWCERAPIDPAGVSAVDRTVVMRGP